MPLASAFQDSEDISAWSMEGLFAACLGLSFRLVTPYNLWLFSDVIEQFGLDKTRIESLSSSFPPHFPAAGSSASIWRLFMAEGLIHTFTVW